MRTWNHTCYTGYIYCIYDVALILMYSCADIWSAEINQQIFCLDISLIFQVSVKHWLCVHLGLLTLTCFIIDYHVNKDTQYLLFACVQPSKCLYYNISKPYSYVSEGALKILQAGTCLALSTVAFMIVCNFSNSGGAVMIMSISSIHVQNLLNANILWGLFIS